MTHELTVSNRTQRHSVSDLGDMTHISNSLYGIPYLDRFLMHKRRQEICYLIAQTAGGSVVMVVVDGPGRVRHT